MEAFNSGVHSGAVVLPQVQALEAGPGRLEAERPSAAPRPATATPDAFPLGPDRRQAVVDSLVEAVVV